MRRRLASLCFLLTLAGCGGSNSHAEALQALAAGLVQRAEAARPPAPVADCACPAPETVPLKPALELTPAGFAELPGWADDELAAALPALLASCRALLAQPEATPVGPGGLAGTVADWREPCDGLTRLPADPLVLRSYLESWFRPFLVADASKPAAEASQGLFTGYYEPEVQGSLTPEGDYRWPLYAPPPDLLRIRLGRFRADLEGQTLFGRLEGQDLVPYHDRAAIDDAQVLAGQGLELLYLADYVQLFFLQVQGSGRVALPDGRLLRVGYAANNGHPFTAIGRLLLEEKLIGPGEATAQGVMAWLRANPEAGWAMMQRNPRYIFFRLLEGEGPLGSQGVALTPGRSLAVDAGFLPLGAPLWLDTTWPAGGQGDGKPLRRLVVAQDTGGAITGPVRGDLFWGAGEAALAEAGRMKQPGRYWLLLPASVAERQGN